MYRDLVGQYRYGYAATGGATVTIPVGATLLQVLADGGGSGGTLVVLGGDAITLAAGQQLDLRFMHSCAVAGAVPTVVTTSTVTAFVDYVRPGSSI
jgi:hypothetical protein